MKLETIFAISMALAIPSAITAQNDSVENERGTASLTFGIDESGIDFAVTGGYADGTTVLLVSLGQTDEGNGLQIPAGLGGGEINLDSPMFVLAVGQADEEGNYHLPLSLDTQALANAGLTVYVQALSINSSDWPDVPAEPTETGPAPILISSVATVDFYMGMQEFAEQNQQGQGGSRGGDESPDGDDGTDGEGECRCPAEDDGRDDETIK